MKTKFIFTMVLLVFLNMSLFSLPGVRTDEVLCEPHETNVCAHLHVPGVPSPVAVPGTAYSVVEDVPSRDLALCSTGETNFTSIFIDGYGIVGDGVGYLNVEGCFNSTSNKPIFTSFTSTTTTNSYQDWLDAIYP